MQKGNFDLGESINPMQQTQKEFRLGGKRPPLGVLFFGESVDPMQTENFWGQCYPINYEFGYNWIICIAISSSKN